MSPSAQPTVPSGWYADPSGDPQQRWWNGTAWTESVAANTNFVEPGATNTPTMAKVPPTEPAGNGVASGTLEQDEGKSGRRELRQPDAQGQFHSPAAPLAPRHDFTQIGAPTISNLWMPPAVAIPPVQAGIVQAGVAQAGVAQAGVAQAGVVQPGAVRAETGQLQTVTTTAPLTTPLAAAAPVAIPAQKSAPTNSFGMTDVPYQPFGMKPEIVTGSFGPPTRSHTPSAWVLAAMPILVLGAFGLAGRQLGQFYTQFVQGGLLFILILLMIALALRDRRELRDAGYVRPASVAWLALTPLAYLAARALATRRESGKGAAPFVVTIALTALIAVGALTGVFLTPEFVAAILVP